MVEIVSVKPVSKQNVSPGELFDAKGKVESTHTSELVIALCGPIGSPVHRVAETIKYSLEKEFDYEKCAIVRLSQFIEKHSPKADSKGEYNRIAKLIQQGDDLRKLHGPSVLAELAVAEIAVDRQRAKAKAAGEIYKPRRVPRRPPKFLHLWPPRTPPP